MKINFKKLSEKAITPKRGSKSAAGYDLYSTNEHTLYVKPHGTLMVKTDIAAEIPEGYFGAIFGRSGKACREGIRPATCVSVIDSDYRGNIGVPVHNDTDRWQLVQPFERLAQIVFLPYLAVEWVEVEELSETQRGGGGFGSTGTN